LAKRTKTGDLASRIVLGTVQLGLAYGRRRESPIMSEAAAFRILDAAFSLGIRAFDTAEAYGSSAERLRKWIHERGNADSVKVVTKCAVDSATTEARALEERANDALSRFAGVSDLLLLTHGAVGTDLWLVVVYACSNRNAAAGQSVYTAAEVRAVADLPDMERVQVPGNVFDKRAIMARGARAVPLDVRSIYLQGVLLEDPESAELRAPGAGKLSAAAQNAAARLDLEVAPLLIASMLRGIAPRDRLVIGVDDASELDVLPKAFEISDKAAHQFTDEVNAVVRNDPLDAVLDPRRWPQSTTE
jgi:aryl-alcohol dehydrogenase-like predicted oxidoreductase